MCGALTAKADAEEELAFALSLINKVTDGMLGRGTTIGVHICRGNWSTEDDILLRGPYYPLIPYLEGCKCGSTWLLNMRHLEQGNWMPFVTLETSHSGLVSLILERLNVESVDDIVARVEEVRAILPDEKILLNPDCGFGTFAQRPMNSDEIAFEKLKVMVEAAKKLREMVRV